jgi:hypothetical protein
MLVIVKGKFHPWMALTLAILAGASVLVLLLRKPGNEAPTNTPETSALLETKPARTSNSGNIPSVRARTDEISPEELDRFRKNLRRTLLRSRYSWIASSSAKDLFVAGRMREAVQQSERELVARTANGDRDAAVLLFGAWHGCSDQDLIDTQREVLEGATKLRAQLQAKTSRLTVATRARALAAIDVREEQTAILAAMCQGPAPTDMADLEEKVRRAASDGHTPSLEALASIAAWNRDDASRERYLLSASLLGDAEAQWRVAGLYGKRLATDPNSKDRGKMRFWLEQAYDKVPAAAFELGQCLLADCDGQPANPERAHGLIESAARQGYPLAIDFMIQGTDGIDGGDNFARFTWLDFQARLADDGCNLDYFMFPSLFDDKRARTRDSFYPNERAQADQRGKELYDRYGAGARAALGCN